MARTTTKSAKKEEARVTATSNPYVMAVFTAVLAGIFSIIGSYYTAGFQARQAMAQKHFEYRVLAYTAFLEKTNHAKAPAISQILAIGSMADQLATDGEIQEFEDRIAHLLKKHSAQDIYWQLNADLNSLRLHGTPRVAEICDDILKSLLLRDHEINWSKYPTDLVAVHDRWNTAQDKGQAYGWIELVSSDERLMIVMISKLTQALIAQLRTEIHGPST